jgi:hypothetical protein
MGGRVLLLCEHEFSVTFEGLYQLITFECYDPRAVAVGVLVRRDYLFSSPTSQPSIREQPVLLVRDRGSYGKDPPSLGSAVVVRRTGRMTPIPEFCGPMVGRFSTDGADWLVFAHRVPPAEVIDVPAPLAVPAAAALPADVLASTPMDPELPDAPSTSLLDLVPPE